MSGTIPYSYDPQQVVWVIATCTTGVLAVREGTVIRVRGTVLGSPVTVTYDIKLTDDNGTTPFTETDVFASVSLATTEYQSRLTS